MLNHNGLGALFAICESRLASAREALGPARAAQRTTL